MAVQSEVTTIQQDGQVWAWHIYYDVLVGPLNELIERRIEFIQHCKPPSEIELRLRLLKPVQGQLPAELFAAWRAQLDAYQAYLKSPVEQREAAQDAQQAFCAVEKGSELQALHAKECPDCPWDGNTILPRRE